MVTIAAIEVVIMMTILFIMQIQTFQRIKKEVLRKIKDRAISKIHRS